MGVACHVALTGERELSRPLSRAGLFRATIARSEGPMNHAPLDVVVLVPFQPYTGHAIEPLFRQTMGSRLYPYFIRGYSEFARFVGRDLLFRDQNRPVFGAEQRPVEFKHAGGQDACTGSRATRRPAGNAA
jgi:hypothetical protein